ncbi:hypothetical protein [Leptotrichia massiliensis]|uniref:toxin-antitoxin system YwqK family antitoxin n=1 Tax=Leptotrichia massiliensis TaxID=1852388 RepID=UPI0028CFF9BA|nr:hypothetical protein [Leptotrichia massiliensis]
MDLKVIIRKNHLLILFLILSNLTYSIQLSTVKGLDRLSNYNEIKNINVNRIYEKNGDKPVFNRENGITYIKGEKVPFDGIMIARENGNILGIYQYFNGINEGIGNDYFQNGQLHIKVNKIKGKSEGEGFEYYSNGKLKDKRIYKNGVIIEATDYYQNGKLKRTFKSTGGLNGVITGYYENGVKSSVQNVTQDYSVRGEISYISNGQALAYDKKGTLLADLNYKNDSIIGLQQKFYVNGKLKYDLIAASEDPKNFKAMDYAIEYYDNSDIIKLDCREKERGKGKWTCKEYNKNGSFKREFDSPTYKFKQSGTKDWINYLLPVLKLLTGW